MDRPSDAYPEQGGREMFDPELQPAAHKPQIGPPPSQLAQEVAKFSNTFLTSATMGVLRALITPAREVQGMQGQGPSASSAEGKMPAWMNADYQKENLYRTQMKNVMKDTVAFTAAAYLMEGMEQLMKMMRGGVDDWGNKAMGGVAAGGLLAQIWYPGRPQSRAILTSTGAVVGYLSYVSEQATKKYLLENQIKLEKEILHKRDDQVKKEVDMHLLRELVRLKQAAALQDKQRQQMGGPPGDDLPGKGWPSPPRQLKSTSPVHPTLSQPPSSVPEVPSMGHGSIGPSLNFPGGTATQWGDVSKESMGLGEELNLDDKWGSQDRAAEEWQYNPGHK